MSGNARRGERASKGVGRPTKYQPEHVETVLSLEAPATVSQIAAALNVGVSTVYEWQGGYPEFSDAIKRVRERADGQVECALHTNAVEKHNVAAQIFWLKNRRPDEWRDKVEHEVKGEPIQFIFNIGGQRQEITAPPGQIEGELVDVEAEDASD